MKIIEVPEYIKGLIFDCDGTLVDSMPLHMKAWEHAITQAGGIWDYDFIFSKKGMQGKDILASYNDSFGMNLEVEQTARVKQEYFRKYCAEMKPIDAVVDIVHRYASRLPMAIASGGSCLRPRGGSCRSTAAVCWSRSTSWRRVRSRS